LQAELDRPELRTEAAAALRSLIENVGNFVCPALFDLGEHAKVVILSVTEGEDKPLKYPQIFRAADLVLLNKIDLLPHLDFDRTRATDNLRAVNPVVAVLEVSARHGDGLAGWYEWLRGRMQAAREAAFA
jgi:hydrogenase nickel incorporation protein HypB